MGTAQGISGYVLDDFIGGLRGGRNYSSMYSTVEGLMIRLRDAHPSEVQGRDRLTKPAEPLCFKTGNTYMPLTSSSMSRCRTLRAHVIHASIQSSWSECIDRRLHHDIRFSPNDVRQN